MPQRSVVAKEQAARWDQQGSSRDWRESLDARSSPRSPGGRKGKRRIKYCVPGYPCPRISGQKTPQKGDIAVFEKNDKHEHGHVEAYDGKQWVSDFKQKNFSPYKSDTPSVTVYRLPGTDE
jgi:hypothetical protein